MVHFLVHFHGAEKVRTYRRVFMQHYFKQKSVKTANISDIMYLEHTLDLAPYYYLWNGRHIFGLSNTFSSFHNNLIR